MKAKNPPNEEKRGRKRKPQRAQRTQRKVGERGTTENSAKCPW
jgi:hypothetical protein